MVAHKTLVECLLPAATRALLPAATKALLPEATKALLPEASKAHLPAVTSKFLKVATSHSSLNQWLPICTQTVLPQEKLLRWKVNKDPLIQVFRKVSLSCLLQVVK